MSIQFKKPVARILFLSICGTFNTNQKNKLKWTGFNRSSTMAENCQFMNFFSGGGEQVLNNESRVVSIEDRVSPKVRSSYGLLAYFFRFFFLAQMLSFLWKKAQKRQHLCQKWKDRKNMQVDYTHYTVSVAYLVVHLNCCHLVHTARC